MLNFFKKLLDYNQRELNRIQKTVDEINAVEDKARHLKDADFAAETKKLKESVQSGEKTLDNVLPWAYALVREAARRTLGQRHFDVQMMAAIALHEGRVAEQKTGEGKTLSATAPLYLNALSGKGTHLVTVNDYLARRDAGWMGEIFHKLGMSVSAIISEQSFIFDPTPADSAGKHTDTSAADWRLVNLRPITRKEAYDADITYGINSEFGFDYLRDNMSYRPDNLVQRGFNFAIIDEVDSVLIDEARTPHIISAPYDEDTSKYYDYARIVKRLDGDTDYVIDEKARTAHMTEQGIVKIEKMLGVDNVYEKDFETLFHVEAALKARALFKAEKDYIVKDDEVIIVDEFTGRLLHGRRFSEGIHQAIEAKENVTIKRESRTLATVSLQNYFRMYDKLAGMTGTAATEAEELNKIYGLEVIVVPTHRDMIRQDHPDLIYKTERGKFTALADEIARHHKKGRPILVGTTSIEKNEILSSLLKKKGVVHELLNAKNHAREATIIANAGKRGAVTVATNMAGRGVDIVLGGEAPSKFENGDLKDEKDNYKKEMKAWRKQHDEVVNLGGLYVIGTERHESRRIDNQLRGRSGRQGDPGETRFFVSLEDDLMRIFGGEQVGKLMTFFNIPENQPLEHSMVSKALEQAQVKVEGFNFDIRKHLVEFDDVLNKQREIIYRLRRKVLTAKSKNGEVLKEQVLKLFSDEVAALVNMYVSAQERPDFEKLAAEFSLIVPGDRSKLEGKLSKLDAIAITDLLKKELEDTYKSKQKEFGLDLWLEVGRSIFLTTIDKYWTEHLTAIADLREGINLRGFAQLDPLIEYKNEAYSMFEKLLSDIDYEVTRRILKVELRREHAHVEQAVDEDKMKLESASSIDPFTHKKKAPKATSKPQRPQYVQPAADHVHEEHPHSHTHDHEHAGGFKITPPGVQKKQPGRNDPCPCGSGKKWKKCHYPDIP